MDSVIEQAQQGRPEAIAHLYQTYVERIFRYVAYRVDSTADAEDLTAEVFVKMVEDLPKYRDTGAPFEAWLFRIAAARIADFYRRHRRRPVTVLDDSLRDGKPSPEEYIQAEQEVATLRHALQQLSDEQQTVLLLRFVERKSHQEVAEIIEKSESAVKSIQHRALIQLTALLGSEEKVRHYLRGSRHE